jgi:hypothetical protein
VAVGDVDHTARRVDKNLPTLFRAFRNRMKVFGLEGCRIQVLRLAVDKILQFHFILCTVFSIAVFGITVFSISVLGIKVFSITVFSIAVFGIAVFGIVVFGIAVFGIAVFGIAVFGIAVF